MTYITTKTPMVAMPRSEAKSHHTPSTELAYLSAYDALCKKERRVGKLPEFVPSRMSSFDQETANDAVIGAIKCGVVRSADMVKLLGYSETRMSYILAYMRKRGMIDYDYSKLQWSVK